MALSGVLKGFRDKGYGAENVEPDDGDSRVIKLTDDEVKALAQYGDGKEATCQVTGRVNGNELTVTSVSAGGGGENDEMAEAVMSKMGQAPVMQPQTMPSPS
jgi:hypothetical protein